MRWHTFQSPIHTIIEHGNLRYLKWTIKEGYHKLTDKAICFYAAKYGRLEILEWARELNCPWDWRICWIAALHEHFKLLVWAYENGCPWDSRTTRAATAHNNLEMLEFLKRNGCPWDEYAAEEAAKKGNIEVLKWLKNNINVTFWNYSTCCVAAYNGKLETLKWLKENGCPFDWYDCFRLAKKKNRQNVIEWLRFVGPE